MAVAYELWDPETRNLIGSFKTQREALATVADTVRRYGAGSKAATSLGLIRTHGDPGKALVAEGRALVDRALGVPGRKAGRRRAPA
jgi:hypothetical protein